jgi:copper chaperone
MTCSGCSGAVTRVLNKAKLDGSDLLTVSPGRSIDVIGDPGGVSNFTVDLETQEVLVKGTIPYDELLEKIKKTGKEVWS